MFPFSSRVPASWRVPDAWLSSAARWFGALQVWIGLSAWMSDTVPWVAAVPGLDAVALPLATMQIIAGVSIMQGRWSWIRAAASVVVACGYALSLAVLSSGAAWVHEAGGFPALGGPGGHVIKHLAIAALAVWIAAVTMRRPRVARKALGVARFGTVLVMLWIGVLKFVPYEANDIAPLLASSPFLGWMGSVFDTEGASDLIGVVEVLAGILLLGWPHRPRTGTVGIVLAFGTFATTLTFLFSLPGWADDTGAPWLGDSGIFFMKDPLLGLICALSLVLEQPCADTLQEPAGELDSTFGKSVGDGRRSG